jgi:hypothetical protein
MHMTFVSAITIEKETSAMKVDSLTKLLLGLIAVLLFMNLMHGMFVSQPASAARDNEAIGRYQIATWAAQLAEGYLHEGYYILDTVTGKVVGMRGQDHSGAE